MKLFSLLMGLFLLCPVGWLFSATYTYDHAGQLVAESYSNGSHAFYEYDDIGNPVKRTTIAPKVNPEANLAVTSSVSPSPATAGAPVTITINVTNNGPDPATEVTVTDVVPNEIQPTEATSTQGNCAITGQNVDCLLGTLANGQTVTVTIMGTALASGNVANTVNATAPEESDVSDNASTTNTVIGGGVDLAFSFLQRGPSPAANNGSSVGFIARVTNLGASEATNVVQTLTLPPELPFALAIPAEDCTHVGGVVTYQVGAVAPGAMIDLIVLVNTTATTGTFTTTSSLVSAEVDLDLTNNQTQIDTEVLAPTLTVTNTGGAGAGTLRQAILDANANPDADIIAFNLPILSVQTIAPVTDLPAITEPVMIDGLSAAAGLVEINGTGITDGITINASNTCLRGLVINRCGNTGIMATGPDANNRLTGITIQGCLIGTAADGTTDLGNADDGIDFANVNDSSIGGGQFWMPNVISGNDDNGVFIAQTCDNLVISGNRIGVDTTGEIAVGNTDDGVVFQGANSRIGGSGHFFGNIISGNGENGLNLSGDGNLVISNCIGTDFDGLTAIPNAHANNTKNGLIAGGGFTKENLIGGDEPSERNLISGNNHRNVRLLPNVRFCGNFVGTEITGSAVIGGAPFSHGVHLLNGTTLGGILPGEGNVISGNLGSGILIDDFIIDDVLVVGNKIGTNAGGTAAIGNGIEGIRIKNSAGTKRIGLDVVGSGNLISGNDDEGITIDEDFGDPIPANIHIQGNKIGTNDLGTAAIPNGDEGIRISDGTNIRIGSPISAGRNLISSNEDAGIRTSTGTDIRIEGNFIGTDIEGQISLGNGDQGVNLFAENSQVIDNLISGNGNGTFKEEGLQISGNNITVQGNKIGTNVGGTVAIPNGHGGIQSFATNVVIGGTESGQGNLTSGNERDNMEIFSVPATIVGNIIGPDVTGTQSLVGTPALSSGARLLGSTAGGIFGQPIPGGGNLVSANTSVGIDLSGDGWNLQNNHVGTTADGLGALPNGFSGLSVSSIADGGLVGGSGELEGNLISGNTGDGIFLAGEDLMFQGNRIGLSADDSPLGNGANGILSRTIFGINLVGGTNAGEGNRIAHNTLAGVRNEGSGSLGGADLTILGNAIFSNGGLGIELSNTAGDADGVTPNDDDDPDEGANDFQNFPLVTVAASTGDITATLNSVPSTTFRIEFFANTVCDDSDHGEGERFLGAMDLNTDAGGDGAINFAVPAEAVVAGGEFVSATATDPDGKTSEFGPCLIVSGTGTSNDLDGDGMSNAYELEHFGTETGGDPNADLDGDGLTNLFEFLTLTDPNDADSAFEATLGNAGGSATITIQTENGRVYQLHESSDMMTFLLLGDPVIGNGGLVELVQPNPGVRRFYQITVSLP